MAPDSFRLAWAFAFTIPEKERQPLTKGLPYLGAER